MAAPLAVPVARLAGDTGLISAIKPDDLVYFLLNVGDGDTQLLLLPVAPADQERGQSARRAVIVDSAEKDKLPRLVDELVAAGLLGTGEGSIPLVIATHPHADHINGMPEILNRFHAAIDEFWDPGYYHPIAAYHQMMAEIENHAHIVYAQPTSGLRRWIGNVALTVLAPSVHLRNRFDSYGVDINDASIALRVEYPAARVVKRDRDYNYVSSRRAQALVLGADARHVSWSYAATDFPQLAGSGSAVAKALGMAKGTDLLRGQVLKVAHHASKHGVNLEVVERNSPSLTLISSSDGSGRYNFPHTVAQEVIREALHPSTQSLEAHPRDWELNVFYTSDRDDSSAAGAPLGSMAVVLDGRGWELWRLGDAPGDPATLGAARRWVKS